MKVYRLVQPKALEARDLPVPELRADEVRVKVSHIGLCGSDLQLYQGTYKAPSSYPVVFGHEWSGTVLATGPGVRSLQPGDRVTGDCSRYCGTCEYCREDRNLCREIEKFGITVDGASAESIVRREMYLYRAPDGIDLSHLSLAEPLAVSAHLIGKIRRIRGDLAGKRALVLGAGAIGLGALLLLRHRYGVERVDVHDVSAYRLGLARELGAGQPGADLFGAESRGSGYRDLYQAEYDLVIESTGHPGVFARTLDLVKPLGVVGCLGMIPEAAIRQRNIVVKGLTLLGSIGGTGEFEPVIDFIAAHGALVDRLISHRFPIGRADEAFLAGMDRERSLKVVLEVE